MSLARRNLFHNKVRLLLSAVGVALSVMLILILNRAVLGAGVETLLTGGGAALLAYVVGSWLRAAFGAA